MHAGVADHDLDTGKPLIGKDAIDSPRGALFQNTGTTYLYGVAAEHSSQYQSVIAHPASALSEKQSVHAN
jgi:hypothetical protein